MPEIITDEEYNEFDDARFTMSLLNDIHNVLENHGYKRNCLPGTGSLEIMRLVRAFEGREKTK